MSDPTTHRPPPLRTRDGGEIDTASLGDVIQWFLDFDERVAIIRHRNVEELFQWKQLESEQAGESVYFFNSAEDRLAVGIVQDLAEFKDERSLHGWIGQMLNALDESTKNNESVATDYKLETTNDASAVKESAKIPTARARSEYLHSCWLESLCTAELRVLGWVYQELYGKFR
jgi:hypothetical protein